MYTEYSSLLVRVFLALRRLLIIRMTSLNVRIQSYINYIIKPDFFVYFYITFFAIFGEENIRVGFRGISLIPFNPEAMISKLDIKLYMPTSIEPFSAEADL